MVQFLNISSKFMIGLVAILHFFFLWLEMFGWKTVAKQFYGDNHEQAYIFTKDLAANQGLYNGFLAAGLIWTFFIKDPQWQKNISIYFLSCIILAGLYGSLTSQKIFFVQALPAIVAIVLVILHSNS